MEGYKQVTIDKKTLDAERSELIGFMQSEEYDKSKTSYKWWLKIKLGAVDKNLEELGRRIEMFEGYPSLLKPSSVC